MTGRSQEQHAVENKAQSHRPTSIVALSYGPDLGPRALCIIAFNSSSTHEMWCSHPHLPDAENEPQESCTDFQDGSELRSAQDVLRKGPVLFPCWTTPNQKPGEVDGVIQNDHLTLTHFPPFLCLLFFFLPNQRLGKFL